MTKVVAATTDVIRRRLANQFLTRSGPKRASDVVRSLGAVQAQDYAGAKWALAQRTKGATDADVERELSDGTILRTHVLRPTWHFVAPTDIRWMLALTAPRVNAAMAYYDRQLGLDATHFRRSNDALVNALMGGNHLTRVELAAALERAGVRVRSIRGAAPAIMRLMMRAEMDAVVCSGPRRGKQFSYALLDERVPPTTPLDRDEALLELARRYFKTRGPATANDFAWWSGLIAADVKRALQIAQADLRQLSLGERDAWHIPRRLPKHTPSAHLLPNYDEYFIGYKDRSAVGERLGHSRPVIGGDASITHVIFVDGQLVGSWRRLSERDKTVLAIKKLSRLTPAETARITAETKRLGTFLGAPLTVRGL